MCSKTTAWFFPLFTPSMLSKWNQKDKPPPILICQHQTVVQNSKSDSKRFAGVRNKKERPCTYLENAQTQKATWFHGKTGFVFLRVLVFACYSTFLIFCLFSHFLISLFTLHTSYSWCRTYVMRVFPAAVTSWLALSLCNIFSLLSRFFFSVVNLGFPVFCWSPIFELSWEVLPLQQCP